MKHHDLSKLMPAEVKSLALSERVILVTALGEQEMKRRIEDLRVETRKYQDALGSSIEDYPDLRENATYDFIQNKLSQTIPREIGDLREKLAVAQRYEKASRGKVAFGDVVTTENQAGEQSDIWLAGPVEASYLKDLEPPPVSYLSPMGQALWGAKIGSAVIFSVGSGEQTIQIIGTRKASA